MKSDPNAQAHALCACTIGWVPPEGVFQPSYACQRESLRCCWFSNRHREVKWINAVHTEVKCAPLSSLIHPQGLLGVQESFVEGTNDLFFFSPLIQSWKISLWHRQCLPLLKSYSDPAGLIFAIWLRTQRTTQSVLVAREFVQREIV